MNDFKKSSLFRLGVFVLMFCFAILFCADVSLAGPLGLFPNFHPFQRVANVASAPFRGGCGDGWSEARYERRAARGSCANGACQAPTQAPTQAPAKQVQAPPPRK